MTIRQGTRRLLVTGFGPFGEFTENPSAILAQRSGRPFQILPVTFTAVDAFLEELDPGSFESLIMLGVAGNARLMRWETVARNWVGARADVDGQTRGPGPIEPGAAEILEGPAECPVGPLWQVSTSAGDYLCNYLFYRARQRFPGHKTSFIHVPPVTALDLETQCAAVREALDPL